ncbi:linoleate diol synthase [Colletotrichum camelliae]|nr:linoleate diol synthase [Colletotrichum camelliae]
MSQKRGSHSSGVVEHEHVEAHSAKHDHGVRPHARSLDIPSKGDPTYGKHDVKLSGLRKALAESKRPLPVMFGDGSYPVDQSRPGKWQEIKALGSQDFKTLYDIFKGKIKDHGIQDDKTMIMERTIQIVAKLPHRSRLRDILTNVFIEQLWDSLEHPPLLYLDGPQDSATSDALKKGLDGKIKPVKFMYRTADGSYNNPLFPLRGAAKQPYARSVKPHHVSLGALPDPGLVFDSVMARRSFRRHPNNVSSVLWYWATIIIHDLFWTDRENCNISNTSAYLDLSPLYGSSQEMQDDVRTHKDGKLHPDAFADGRLNGMPPGVCVLLVMLNRFHNHVAENLAAINENNRFPPPAASDEKAKKRYDEDLFQTARLVTCGLYINITLVDYVRNIVNLNRTNTTWTLDPRQEAGASAGTPKGAEIGTGNVNSAEFNLCYRWHSCVSEQDDKWIKQAYQNKLANVVPKEKTDALASELYKKMGSKSAERTFAKLQRDKNTGKFNDDELVEIITSSVESVAGSFGARNVPLSMKNVEVAGIKQAREWNVAGLNEFRKHFGLKPYETFEEMNPDTDVAEALRHLYQHPDNVELYPGLVAEDSKKPMSPGVGIAPTYTISRVVLSDAVCLVRGDRYYTIDYNPRNLTNWGFKEVEYDLDVNHGCVFYKLFLRAFPNHFKDDSVYAHYPMVIPSETEKILTDLERHDQFDYSRPTRLPTRVNILSNRAATHISKSEDKYRVTWSEGLGRVMGNPAKPPSSGDNNYRKAQAWMDHELRKGNGPDNIKNFYFEMTRKLLNEKSYTLGFQEPQTHVDIVRDVGNLAHVHFASHVFNLPLKTMENPKGVFTEQEMYRVLAAVFDSVFLNSDPVKSFPLQKEAQRGLLELGAMLEKNVKSRYKLPVDKALGSHLTSYGTNLVAALSKDGVSAQDITWNYVLPTAVAMVPAQAQMFAQAVNYYLDHADLVMKIHRVAIADQSKEADAELLGYAMEGIRLGGGFSSSREATVDEPITDERIVNGELVHEQMRIQQGNRISLNFTKVAGLDPTQFPDPQRVNPKRPLESYVHYNLATHGYLGTSTTHAALIGMFRAVFERQGVERLRDQREPEPERDAEQPQGILKKVTRSVGSGHVVQRSGNQEGAVITDGVSQYLTEDWATLRPFPVSMKVRWKPT